MNFMCYTVFLRFEQLRKSVSKQAEYVLVARLVRLIPRSIKLDYVQWERTQALSVAKTYPNPRIHVDNAVGDVDSPMIAKTFKALDNWIARMATTAAS